MTKTILIQKLNGDSPAVAGPVVRIKNGSDKIYKGRKIAIVFDYPLYLPQVFVFTSASGFTRQKLYKLIKAGYRRVYRRPSNIWGHYMRDLVIEAAVKDGNFFNLEIGS